MVLELSIMYIFVQQLLAHGSGFFDAAFRKPK